MALPSIMSSAQAGLQAAQAGLLVSSQNIAGSSVEGYSRRNANTVISGLAPNSTLITGTSFSVEGFTRSYSRLLESQRLTQQGKTSYSDTLVQSTEMLDAIIADQSNSLAAAVSEFFDAAGRLVGDPNNLALRASLTAKSELVSQRMVGTAQVMDQLQTESRAALKATLESANTDAGRLAQINVKILEGFSAGNFTPSADLLDERDRLLMSLQKKVGGQSVVNSDGTASHYLAGIALVEREQANAFDTENLGTSALNIKIRFGTYQYGNTSPDGQRNLTTTADATKFITGGEAGAHVKLLADFIPDLNRRLDAVAIGMVWAANSASGNPIFGFSGSNGAISDPSVPPLNAITGIASSNDIFAIRDMLDPSSSKYNPALAEAALSAMSFISVAPKNPEDYTITSEQMQSLEGLRGYFASPIADVITAAGNSIGIWVSDQAANESIMGVLNSRRESISGVNLDEEAANMIKFQQLYAASSKVIQTGNQMFDTLLAMISN